MLGRDKLHRKCLWTNVQCNEVLYAPPPVEASGTRPGVDAQLAAASRTTSSAHPHESE